MLGSGKPKAEKPRTTCQMFLDFLVVTARWRMTPNKKSRLDTFRTRTNCVPQPQCLASGPSGRRLGASGGGAQSINTTEHEAKHRVQSTRHRAKTLLCRKSSSTEHRAQYRARTPVGGVHLQMPENTPKLKQNQSPKLLTKYKKSRQNHPQNAPPKCLQIHHRNR